MSDSMTMKRKIASFIAGVLLSLSPAYSTSFVMVKDADLFDQASIVSELRVVEAEASMGPVVARTTGWNEEGV